MPVNGTKTLVVYQTAGVCPHGNNGDPLGLAHHLLKPELVSHILLQRSTSKVLTTVSYLCMLVSFCDAVCSVNSDVHRRTPVTNDANSVAAKMRKLVPV